ncbi:MAG TPA: class I SAM-dependent methyltransferase [Actinomycetaceae bacterium]|nr:class I SAM-dependent methyltransferase [Actinomycetaceae bacterium]
MTTVAGLRLLLTPEGQALLAALPPYDPESAERIAQGLAGDVDPELLAAALSQQRLRREAEAKLGDFAHTMLFSEAGLRAATHLGVAAHHARRFRDAGITRVFDLGCGLGVDSLALAALGLEVVAVERDEATAALALYNLRAFPDATVVHGDAFDVVREGVGQDDGVYADLGLPLDALPALRARVPAVGLTVSPALPHGSLPHDAHAQWVSVGGDVVEAGLWFGSLADGPGRSALVLRGGRHATLEITDDPRSAATAPSVGPLRRFLIEPDPAVVQAGGVAVLAEMIDGAAISGESALLTSDVPYEGPFGETCEAG